MDGGRGMKPEQMDAEALAGYERDGYGSLYMIADKDNTAVGVYGQARKKTRSEGDADVDIRRSIRFPDCSLRI